MNRPDVKGREGILGVHTRKIPLSDDVDVSTLARGTSGFSGADLANLVNEAALNAARYSMKVVRMVDFEFAKDKVLMGAERRSMIISDAEKKITAIHEAGHAILTVLLPHADPIHKVTIIPRGMALGLTQQLPTDEKHNYSRDYLNDQLAILLGGRIAEEITLGSITTGAGNDLERATELARRMVCEWGMSDSLGPLTFGKKEEQIFLGREIAQRSDYSADTAIRIDQEIKRFVTEAYNRALEILQANRASIEQMADELLLREVLDADQVRRIVAGQPLEAYVPAKPPTPVPPPRRRSRPPRAAAVDGAAAQQAASSGIGGTERFRVPGSTFQVGFRIPRSFRVPDLHTRSSNSEAEPAAPGTRIQEPPEPGTRNQLNLAPGTHSEPRNLTRHPEPGTRNRSSSYTVRVSPRPSFDIPLPNGRHPPPRRAHARDGDPQRHARLICRRRPARRPGSRGRACVGDGGGGRRPDRHRRGIDPAGRGPAVRGRGTGARRAGAPRAGGRLRVPLSIDTYKADVAEAALDLGAAIVNDISALSYDPALPGVVARTRAAVILMHTRGRSRQMYQEAHYDDVVREVSAELGERLRRAGGQPASPCRACSSTRGSASRNAPSTARRSWRGWRNCTRSAVRSSWAPRASRSCSAPPESVRRAHATGRRRRP